MIIFKFLWKREVPKFESNFWVGNVRAKYVLKIFVN